ncbi:hypothetical protein BDV06DRAFT_225308 [Aspergillus oleicola]
MEVSAWKNAVPGPRECKQAAHQPAMSAVSNGHIELATLQTLCLLVLTELNDGNIVQCRVHAALAMTLARSAKLDHERLLSGQDEDIVEERRRCYWSLIGDHPVNPFSRFVKPQFPASSVSPPPAALTPAGQTMATSAIQPNEHGISSIII